VAPYEGAIRERLGQVGEFRHLLGQGATPRTGVALSATHGLLLLGADHPDRIICPRRATHQGWPTPLRNN
jgi:hypothetical protein